MHRRVVAGELERHRIGMAAQHRHVLRRRLARRLGKARLLGAEKRRLVGGVDDLDFGPACASARMHPATACLRARSGLPSPGRACGWRQWSCLQYISQMLDVARGNIDRHGGFCFPGPGAVLAGTRHMRGPQPAFRCRREIGGMRRDHHAGRRLEIEGARGSKIRLAGSACSRARSRRRARYRRRSRYGARGRP